MTMFKRKQCRCGRCGRRRYSFDVRHDDKSPNGLTCVSCWENIVFGLEDDVHDYD